MRSWTSPDEFAFLERELPAFKSLKEKPGNERYGKATKFINGLYSRFVAAFPLKNDETPNGKRQQLRSWMNWHSERVTHGNKRRANTSTKVDSTLAKLLSSGRMLQEVELYQKRYGEKINKRVNDEISKQGAEGRSHRMQIRRKVVEELWEEDKNKPDIREAIDAAKALQAENKRAGKRDERTPEEYQKALAGMPATVRQVMEMLVKETGWLFLVFGIGPNPTDNGRIYMRKFELGGDDAMTFADSYSLFKEGLEQPLIEYANHCFPNDVCRARAISTQENNSFGNGNDSVGPQVEPAPDTSAKQEERASGPDVELVNTSLVDDLLPTEQVDDGQNTSAISNSVHLSNFSVEGHPTDGEDQIMSFQLSNSPEGRIDGITHTTQSQDPLELADGPTEPINLGFLRNSMPPDAFTPGTDYFVPGATVGSPLATDGDRARGGGGRRSRGRGGRGRGSQGRGRRGRGGQGQGGQGRCARGCDDQGDVDETAVLPGVEGTVDIPTAGGRKRQRTDDIPCEVVAGKRIRKAARDPQGNEYVTQAKSRRGGQ